MTIDDYNLKNIGHASAEDQALFEKWCGPTIREFGPKNGLGRNGKPMPQGAGAHCIQWWRDIERLVGDRQVVFEIGFCIGLSARIILNTVARKGLLMSIDPTNHIECSGSASDLMKQFPPPTFTLLRGKSEEIGTCGEHGHKFSLAFIDGDHEYDSIITDIGVCRRLGIKTMVFDDWHPHFGPHTQRAVIDSGLRVRAIIGNYALCEDDL